MASELGWQDRQLGWCSAYSQVCDGSPDGTQRAWRGRGAAPITPSVLWDGLLLQCLQMHSDLTAWGMDAGVDSCPPRPALSISWLQRSSGMVITINDTLQETVQKPGQQWVFSCQGDLLCLSPQQSFLYTARVLLRLCCSELGLPLHLPSFF